MSTANRGSNEAEVERENPIDYLHKLYGIALNALGVRVAVVLDKFLYGLYHLERETVVAVDWLNETMISINLRGSSISGDNLLRLIYLTHKYDLVFQITPSRKAHDQLGHWHLSFVHHKGTHPSHTIKALEKEFGK